MVANVLASLALSSMISLHSLPVPSAVLSPQRQVLVSHTISLQNRYPNQAVNKVFKDNILLNMAYMGNKIPKTNAVDWSALEQPSHVEFTLQPGQVFAYQEDSLPSYQGKVVKTSEAHFNGQEGFLSDGYLMGDGVCHLASLLHWVLSDALLQTEAPTNHDFAPIPEIPKEYGVSIYYAPNRTEGNAQNNLYILNSHARPVTISLDYENNNLTAAVSEEL
jgi:hypothetical protein